MGDRVHDVSELMEAAAQAMLEGDMERLEDLDRQSADWLQSASERRAQRAMLDAMKQAVEWNSA